MTMKSERSRRTWRDPNTTPEITDQQITEANLCPGKKLVHWVQVSAGSGQKNPTTLRISKDMLEISRVTKAGYRPADDALKHLVTSQRHYLEWIWEAGESAIPQVRPSKRLARVY
jgi:uncharacterized protein (DUF4415 family)